MSKVFTSLTKFCLHNVSIYIYIYFCLLPESTVKNSSGQHVELSLKNNPTTQLSLLVKANTLFYTTDANARAKSTNT